MTATEPPTGTLETGLAGQGSIRWALADLGDVVEQARRQRDYSPLASMALGQLLAAAVLVQRMVAKNPASLLVEARGDGLLQRVVAEADELGNLRGMAAPARAATGFSGEDEPVVRAALGEGALRVVRRLDAGPYESHVPLVPGGLSHNLAHYLVQSEQIRSAVVLGVLTRPEGVAAAGGLILEPLPGADEDVLDGLEQRLRTLPGVSRLLEEGGTGGLLEAALGGLDRESLERRELRLHCPCTRERFLGHLLALSSSDRDFLLETPQEEVRAECSFCGREYLFSPEELRPAQ